LTSNEDIAKLILNPPDLGPGIAQHHVAFKEKISLKMALTLELIWLLRNQVLHQGENINLVPIIRNIECKVQEFLFNHVPQTQKDLDGITRWSCPPPNTIKLNVDATISGHRSTLSVVARNEKGELLKAWAKHLDGGDPLKAETHVVLWALELALLKTSNILLLKVTQSCVLTLLVTGISFFFFFFFFFCLVVFVGLGEKKICCPCYGKICFFPKFIFPSFLLQEKLFSPPSESRHLSTHL
jgi:hypothetical protein